MQVTSKAAGEAALHKLACSQAEAGVEKKSIKVRIGSCLDPLCRVMLVSGSASGSAFGTGWRVYALQSEEAVWVLCSGSSRNNEADALELLWLQHRSCKNSFPCCQTLPVKLILYGYGEASRVHASIFFFFPASFPLFLRRLVVLKAFQLNVNQIPFGVC